MTRPTSVAARRETVVRAGHRRDHVVGSRCKATDEGQYFQREQLFMRHFEFYSVLQALRRTAPSNMPKDAAMKSSLIVLA
jgi:hypothetical protein